MCVNVHVSDCVVLLLHDGPFSSLQLLIPGWSSLTMWMKKRQGKKRSLCSSSATLPTPPPPLLARPLPGSGWVHPHPLSKRLDSPRLLPPASPARPSLQVPTSTNRPLLPACPPHGSRAHTGTGMGRYQDPASLQDSCLMASRRWSICRTCTSTLQGRAGRRGLRQAMADCQLPHLKSKARKFSLL